MRNLLFICTCFHHTSLSLSTQLPRFSLSNLNLSPPEKLLLKSRLSSIQSQIEETYLSQLLPKNSSSKSKNKISQDLVLIFPGAGGPDILTSELQNVIRQCDLDQQIKSSFLSLKPNRWQESKINLKSDNDSNNNSNECEIGERTVVVYDWSSQRGSILSAAYDAEAVGDALAQCLSIDTTTSTSYSDKFRIESQNSYKFRSMHVIGISVGAFAAHQFVQTCHRLKLSSKYRITFLDPFTSRGVIGTNYGKQYFGQPLVRPLPIQQKNSNSKDEASQEEYHVAEHYLNTDDPVPTTNEPLPNCQPLVKDVTATKERESFVLPPGETMHCWPLAYFARFGYASSVSKNQHDRIMWNLKK